MGGAKDKSYGARAPPIANHRKKIGENQGKFLEKRLRKASSGGRGKTSGCLLLDGKHFHRGNILIIFAAVLLLGGAYWLLFNIRAHDSSDEL